MWSQEICISRKCGLCKCPLVDGGVPLILANLEKLSEWLLAHKRQDVKNADLSSMWCCLNCIRDARATLESSPSQEELIWWPDIDDPFFHYFKKGWMKPCYVRMEKMSDDDDPEIANISDYAVPLLADSIFEEPEAAEAVNVETWECMFCNAFFQDEEVLGTHLSSGDCTSKRSTETTSIEMPCVQPTKKSVLQAEKNDTLHSIDDPVMLDRPYQNPSLTPIQLVLLPSAAKQGMQPQENTFIFDSPIISQAVSLKAWKTFPKKVPSVPSILRKSAKKNKQRDRVNVETLKPSTFKCSSCQLNLTVLEWKEHLKNLLCKMCSLQFTCKTKIDGHLDECHKIHGVTRTWSCYLCRKVFVNPSTLNSHLKLCGKKPAFESHLLKKLLLQEKDKLMPSNQKLIKCKTCDMGVREPFYVEHTEDVRCYICHQNFNCKTWLSMHIKTKHVNKKTKKAETPPIVSKETPVFITSITCGFCQQKFSASLFKDHLTNSTSCENSQFKCSFCVTGLSVFPLKSSLDAHIRAIHPNGPETVEADPCDPSIILNVSPSPMLFKCFNCGLMLTKHDWNYHMHDLRCKACKTRFMCKTEMLAHKETCVSGARKVAVKICRNGFESAKKPSLAHVSQLFTKSFPAISVFCERVLPFCQFCGDHLSPCTARARLRHEQATNCKESLGSYVCAICGYAYDYKGQLLRHLFKVTNDKLLSYLCKYCMKSFDTDAKFIRHLQIKHDRRLQTRKSEKGKQCGPEKKKRKTMNEKCPESFVILDENEIGSSIKNENEIADIFEEKLVHIKQERIEEFDFQDTALDPLDDVKEEVID